MISAGVVREDRVLASLARNWLLVLPPLGWLTPATRVTCGPIRSTPPARNGVAVTRYPAPDTP